MSSILAGGVNTLQCFLNMWAQWNIYTLKPKENWLFPWTYPLSLCNPPCSNAQRYVNYSFSIHKKDSDHKDVLKYLPTVLSLQSVNRVMVCTTYLSKLHCTVYMMYTGQSYYSLLSVTSINHTVVCTLCILDNHTAHYVQFLHSVFHTIVCTLLCQ